MIRWLTAVLGILFVGLPLGLGQTYCDSPTLPTFCLGYRKQQSGRFKFTSMFLGISQHLSRTNSQCVVQPQLIGLQLDFLRAMSMGQQT